METKTKKNPVDFYLEDVLPLLKAEAVYGVKFKEGKKRLRGKCPLHGGEDLNFTVSLETLDWKCWSHCGSGTALRFLAKADEEPKGKDWIEAVRTAAELAGVDPSPLDRELTHEEKVRLREDNLLEAFLDLCQKDLLGEPGRAVRDYLTKERGLPEDELAETGLGVCPPPDEVSRRLGALGYSPTEAKDSHVLDARWTGRLVIPWRDRRGHLTTLAARHPGTLAKDSPIQKFLYLTGGTKKDLMGLDVALRTKAGRDELVLVEGLLDVVHLQLRGFQNVAALGGAGGGLTADRWEALSAYGVRSVTLALDTDEPGQVGLLAALGNARNGVKAPVVYVVPVDAFQGAKDPDELVRTKGLEAWRTALSQKVPAARWEAFRLLGDITPESPDTARREAAEKVLGLVERILGPRAAMDTEDALRVTAERTGYTEEALADAAVSLAERRAVELREVETKKTLQESLRALERGTPASTVVSQVREKLVSLEARAVAPPPPFSVDRLLEESRNVPLGKSSGLSALDELEVLFSPAELALVAARTSHGKTTALVNLLLNWLREKTDEVFLFYSAEEPEIRIFHRLLGLEAHRVLMESDRGTENAWTVNAVRDYLRSPESRGPGYEWTGIPWALEVARDHLRQLQDRLLVVYRPGWHAGEVAIHAQEVAREREVGGIFVDYLQRLRPPPASYDRRDMEVSAIGRTFKSLSVDVAAPVVLGAQINRESVPKDYSAKLNDAGSLEEALPIIRTARPELHHLREGGSEQEADLVLGLLNYAADFRRDAKDKVELPASTLLEAGVLKNRGGEVGAWAGLAFEGRFGVLRDPEDEEADAWKLARGASREEREKKRDERLQVRLRIEEERRKAKEAELGVEKERTRQAEADAKKAEAESFLGTGRKGKG